MSVLGSSASENGDGQPLRPRTAGPAGAVPGRALALSAAALGNPFLEQWHEPGLVTDRLRADPTRMR
jgi:hypothetical protein